MDKDKIAGEALRANNERTQRGDRFFLIRQVCKGPVNTVSGVFVCHGCFLFLLDQGGDRKPAFISRLRLIVRARGQIPHVTSPTNCH